MCDDVIEFEMQLNGPPAIAGKYPVRAWQVGLYAVGRVQLPAPTGAAWFVAHLPTAQGLAVSETPDAAWRLADEISRFGPQLEEDDRVALRAVFVETGVMEWLRAAIERNNADGGAWVGFREHRGLAAAPLDSGSDVGPR